MSAPLDGRESWELHAGAACAPLGGRRRREPEKTVLHQLFALDVLACPECSGRMQLIAFIASEAVARRILDHLGLDATGPPLARAQAPDDLLDPAPVHDVVDPVYTD